MMMNILRFSSVSLLFVLSAAATVPGEQHDEPVEMQQQQKENTIELLNRDMGAACARRIYDILKPSVDNYEEAKKARDTLNANVGEVGIATSIVANNSSYGDLLRRMAQFALHEKYVVYYALLSEQANQVDFNEGKNTPDIEARLREVGLSGASALIAKYIPVNGYIADPKTCVETTLADSKVTFKAAINDVFEKTKAGFGGNKDAFLKEWHSYEKSRMSGRSEVVQACAPFLKS
jgi:hypothetical protein